jgi:hypothetical protein
MKTVVFWAVIFVSTLLLWQVVKSGNSTQTVPEISYSDFLARVADGQVSTVTIAAVLFVGWVARAAVFALLRRQIKRRCWMPFSNTG